MLHKTVQLVRQTQGVALDLDAIPLDDAETFRLLGEGRTVGVFQFESRGFRDLLRKLQPQHFEDLVSLVALYRPGPLGSGMVEDFIARRHGRRAITYELPELEPILRSTYGVIVFQEQVMQIATTLAGFTLGAADLLRRAMGKKQAEVMAKQRQHFVQGAVQRGFPEEKAAKIFDLMAYFAGYGFNRSHSVAYALISYRTAFLKAHYPREFMAALLTSDMDHSERIARYLAECRDMGLTVLPPDVNEGDYGFTVSSQGIRFGLGAIKGVGQSAIGSILEERQAHGPFRSFFDFCERVDSRQVNRKVIESLIRGGALDSLGLSRAQMLGNLPRVLEWAQRQQEDRQQGQFSLFGNAAAPAVTVPTLEPVAEWSESERLAAEKEALGFYISSHPLLAVREPLRRLTTASSQTLAECRSEQLVIVGGLIAERRTQLTKNGERMAFLTLEDLEGSVELVVFPEVYRRCQEACESEAPVLVWGRVEAEGENRLIAQRLVPLHAAATQGAFRCLTLTLSPSLPRSHLERLREALTTAPGPCQVLLALQFADGERVVLRAGERYNVAPSMALLATLEELLGTQSVQVS
ncbi:MAG: hypothetical protein KatS3mg131_0781 [Candidatus Tectimicrobiota bacterium]|nr:MAG: hypothetical protein KatS3mg131_0781 [Candidatus Tectomicrobia bacterium]